MLSREELAALLHTHLAGAPNVRQQRQMGAINYSIHDKIFTFVGKSGLVMKLPEARIDALEADGQACHLVMGERVCKEWALFHPATVADFLGIAPLLLEAGTFVAAETVPAPKRKPVKKAATRRTTNP